MRKLAIFLSALLFLSPLHAAPIVFSQGPLNPGTGTDDSSFGSDVWTNPGNITLSDNSYATCSSIDGNNTHYLKGSNYSFALPSGAIVVGIQVDIEKKTSVGGMVDIVVKLVKGGVVVGTDHKKTGQWATSDTVYTYGGATDLWGVFWQAADINSATFGVVISGFNAGTGSFTASIDHIKITVYYIFGTVLYKSRIQ